MADLKDGQTGLLEDARRSILAGDAISIPGKSGIDQSSNWYLQAIAKMMYCKLVKER